MSYSRHRIYTFLATSPLIGNNRSFHQRTKQEWLHLRIAQIVKCMKFNYQDSAAININNEKSIRHADQSNSLKLNARKLRSMSRFKV